MCAIKATEPLLAFRWTLTEFPGAISRTAVCEQGGNTATHSTANFRLECRRGKKQDADVNIGEQQIRVTENHE